MKFVRETLTCLLVILIMANIIGGGESVNFQVSVSIGEKPQAAIEVKENTDTKAEAEPEAKVEAEAQAQAQAKAEAEAQAKAEADAKAKAEAEAKAKAEAEAKAKAEAEAEAKKEAEAKAKAKAEAKAKAKAEAKAKAKAEENVELSDIDEDSSTEERIQAMNDFLVEEGFTPEAAAGVIGNVAVESTFDPSFESRSGYVGLFQWNTNSDGAYWWYSIEEWLNGEGYESYSFEGQMKALIEGPKKGKWSKKRLKRLKQMEDVHQATEYFAIYYEGCEGGDDETEYYELGNCYQALDTRKDEAIIAYELCNDGKEEYDGEKPYQG